MGGLHELDDVVHELDNRDRRANIDLAIRRTLKRIDRALDLRNPREFHRLALLLRDFKAQR